MIEVYRGSANAWECDEMGHMNVRFYVNRMMEGLAEFAHVIGIPAAFSDRASSTLRPRDQHIRYLHEARAGQPLVMRGGVIQASDTSALIYQQLEHADGRICATFQTWVDHLELDTGLPFAWSAQTKAKLESLKTDLPEQARARSIAFDTPPAPSARMADADKAGAITIGRGAVPPAHCDIYGRMNAEMFVARVSDSVGLFLSDWRRALEKQLEGDDNTGRMGGAVIEARWVYRRWPKAGDRFVVRTAIASVSENVQGYHHWLIDPATGKVWATNQTIAIAFDLKKRRLHKISEADQDRLRATAPTGLFV